MQEVKHDKAVAATGAYEPVLAEMVPLVTAWRANPHWELEARVGVRQGHFEAGVSFDYYQALYDALTDEPSLAQWETVPVRHNFRYFYFADHVRGLYTTNDAPVFCRVRRVKVVDVHCHKRQYDLRFSLKEERPLPQYRPPTGAPQRVRVNTRCTLQKGAWRYDFTKTGMGATTQEACQTFRIFVELELARTPELDALNDREVAQTLLGKAVDLLGRYSPQGKEEHLTLGLIET